MADKLYDKYYQKRKELQRLKGIYKKRAKRAKDAGLFESTYLSQIDYIDLGYEIKEDGSIKKDDFSLKEFKTSDQYHQEQLLIQAERKVDFLKKVLDNPMSSLKSMKDLLKKELKTDKLDMNSAQVRDKLSSFRESPESAFKHAKVVQLMEAIDAHKNLTDDEKATLKKLIRLRLSRREKVPYDSSFLEWDVDIEEILQDPKSFIDKYSEGIPEDILKELAAESSKLETTNTPEKLPW